MFHRVGHQRLILRYAHQIIQIFILPKYEGIGIGEMTKNVQYEWILLVRVELLHFLRLQ